MTDMIDINNSGELSQLYSGEHENYTTIKTDFVGESRWGNHYNVVFTERDEHKAYYCLQVEVPGGDGEEFYSSGEVYEVKSRRVTVTEWEKV